MRSRISGAIRRAALLSLSSFGAPALVACGGSTSAGTPSPHGGTPTEFVGRASDDAASNEGSPDATAGDLDADILPPDTTTDAGVMTDAAPCTVLPGAKPVVMIETCWYYEYPFSSAPGQCGDSASGTFDGGTCAQLCPPPFADASAPGCYIETGPNFGHQPPAPAYLMCAYGCGTGRRPSGLRPCPPSPTRAMTAAFLAQTAYLEAASVDAFERLARELGSHGAPARLQRAALRAARDERRHTRVTTALAERHGASPPRPRVPRRGARSLSAMAIENAVEGCVRETFGAAIAMRQAATAADPKVRAAMQRIGEDEIRHAELAWRVARWLDTRLDATDRTRVARARRRAVRALVRDAAGPVHPDLVRDLGLPAPADAHAMALALASTLWNDERASAARRS
jgi:hypothetical protein